MILDNNGIPIRMKFKPGPKIGSKSSKKFRLSSSNSNSNSNSTSSGTLPSGSGSSSGKVKVELGLELGSALGHKKPGPKRIRDRKG